MKGQGEFLKYDFATVCRYFFLLWGFSVVYWTIADQRRENVRQKNKMSESRRSLELFLFQIILNKVRRHACLKEKQKIKIRTK